MAVTVKDVAVPVWHLVRLGHRRIAYIGGLMERHNTVLSFLETDPPPTAVFVANDVMAVACMATVHRSGRSVQKAARFSPNTQHPS